MQIMEQEILKMIFISYSSKDYETAVTTRRFLENNGIPCWMAPESVPMGGDCVSKISPMISPKYR